VSSGGSADGGHTNRVMSVSFSPDVGKWCLGGAMMIVRCVCGMRSRVQAVERRWRGIRVIVSSVSFSPDGRKWYLGGLW